MRYHYRIKGNDIMDELCLPCSFYTTASCLAFFFCLLSPCICLAMCPTYASFLTQLSHEVDVRESGAYHRYLVGYTLATGDSNIQVSRVSEVGTELHGPVVQKIIYDENETTLNAELLQNEILSDTTNPLPPPPPPISNSESIQEGEFM